MLTCDVCQRNKVDLATYPRLLQPLHIPDVVRSHISIDFIDGLPKIRCLLGYFDGG